MIQTEEPKKPSVREPDPKRFEASKLVLFTDSFMNHFIKVGGIAVVVAVIGIFVFILSQVLPMFQSARVDLESPTGSGAALPEGDYVAIASDEWGERPFALRSDGRLFLSDLTDGGRVIESEVEFLEGDTISTVSAQAGSGVIAVGTQGGKVHLLDYAYKASFSGGKRTVKEEIAKGYTGTFKGPVRTVAFGQSGAARLVAALVEAEGGERLIVNLVERKRSLVGSGNWKETAAIDLSASLRPGVVVDSLHVTDRADSLLVVEVTAGEDGLPQPKVKVVQRLAGTGPKVGEDITVTNLPSAVVPGKGFQRAGQYLLPLTGGDLGLYRVAGLPRSPGYEETNPKLPSIYPWTADVQAQLKSLKYEW